ncbi:MAG: hypothetical protein PVJ52_01120 [Candidatus Woesebacteria bacterium]
MTYEECFSLATYVCLSSNSALYDALAQQVRGYEYGMLEKDTLLLQSVSLLQSISTREAIIGLSPEEVAGLVAATLELDTVVRVETMPNETVFTMGGMGGDYGLPTVDGNSKLFSISTLSALALADHGYTHKHHSYPNTSKVAGQSAIESFGARSDFTSEEEMQDILHNSGVLMTSCHSTRTLHTISHVLKGETINHLIGPLAIPHSGHNKVNALVGVNHNVHPETVIEALGILHDKGIQKYGNSVAFCGIKSETAENFKDLLVPEQYYSSAEIKSQVLLDEVPPPPFITLASFMVDGINRGSYFIRPTDFMSRQEVSRLEEDGLFVPNDEESILKANFSTVSGKDTLKSDYLAMTVALAIFTRDYACKEGAFDKNNHQVNGTYLREAYLKSKNSIRSGKVADTLTKYIQATSSKAKKYHE